MTDTDSSKIFFITAIIIVCSMFPFKIIPIKRSKAPFMMLIAQSFVSMETPFFPLSLVCWTAELSMFYKIRNYNIFALMIQKDWGDSVSETHNYTWDEKKWFDVCIFVIILNKLIKPGMAYWDNRNHFNSQLACRQYFLLFGCLYEPG